MRLPKELRAEPIKRLAQLRQFSPEMAQRVSVVLHKRLAGFGRAEPAGLRRTARRGRSDEPARRDDGKRHSGVD